MRRVFFNLLAVFLAAHCFAQSKPLYQLPENVKNSNEEPFLVGTDAGLFRVLSNGNSEPLWTEGRVERILKAGPKYYFVTQKGIVSSADLKSFKECNNGLPFLTIKNYEKNASGKKEKFLVKTPALLKDLCVNPHNPEILVTATKDAVYITKNGGDSWTSIGSSSKNTGGMKAVAVTQMPLYDSQGKISGNELVVFMSHPIYGFSYYRADAKKPAWIDVSAGLYALPGLTQPDEIADILPAVYKNNEGVVYSEIYLSQTYIPNIYRFNWKTKRAERIYAGTESCDTMDGFCQSGSKIIFSGLGKVRAFNLNGNAVEDTVKFDEWKKYLNAPHSLVNAAYVPKNFTGLETSVSLSELWLLNPDIVLTPWGKSANHKKAIYVSAYQMQNMEGINKYKKIIRQNKLNSLVVDMKDDYGLLRFEPESALLKQKGTVTRYKIDVNRFVEEFKKENIYLIARIVVFKDKNLSNYDKKQYAVWDSSSQKPWMGIRGTENETDANGNVTGKKTVYYDENWVDPYSEEVWEYNIEIAKELIARGFDEIQFDYIRFPTDGLNLGKAQYRWKDKGMDKESALVSFLRYARKNINAPIGIDIYGANGWYRSGTRTGQDVELMSDYVDVICPMFYPSHFEQNFLDYNPAVERPYRIYFYGSYRNTVMGRNRIIVRPWAQAFYMNVRYDKKYYDKNYVLRQIFGVRDGVDRGYMYWNNSGGYYDDISPDPQPDEASPWRAEETDLQRRHPAFSSGKSNIDEDSSLIEIQRVRNEQMLSIWNLVLEQEEKEYRTKGNLLLIP